MVLPQPAEYVLQNTIRVLDSIPKIGNGIENFQFAAVDESYAVREFFGNVQDLGGIDDGSTASCSLPSLLFEVGDTNRIHSRGKWLVKQPKIRGNREQSCESDFEN